MAGSGDAHLRRDSSRVALSVDDITVEFPIHGTHDRVRALSGVSFDVLENEVLGIVGESGCGKSTAGRTVAGIWRPSSGTVSLRGEDVTALRIGDERRAHLEMVFQDPIGSLNPRRTIGESLIDPLEIQWRSRFDRSAPSRWASRLWTSTVRSLTTRSVVAAAKVGLGLLVGALLVQLLLGYDMSDGSPTVPVIVAAVVGIVLAAPLVAGGLLAAVLWSALAVVGAMVEAVTALTRRTQLSTFRSEAEQRARTALLEVGIDPDQTLHKRPHEFSGGQAQRICIARSLVREPSVLICDEPVSALDVSVQAQVLNVLHDLTERRDLALVLIAHDLAVVKAMSDRIAVMYLGKICEVGTPDEVFEQPRHPYTRMLLDAIPLPDPSVVVGDEVHELGELPSPVNPPSGCRFRTRCERATTLCAEVEPTIEPTSEQSFVACHHPIDTEPRTVAPSVTVEARASQSASSDRRVPDRPLVSVRSLRTSFDTPRGLVRAVDGVDLDIWPGRTLGVVGESGSGKTVLSRSIMNLLPPNGVHRSGTITFGERRIDDLSNRAMRSLWGGDMAMIFQDPSQSLHPMYKIGRQITDAIAANLDLDDRAARERGIELLRSVRIPDPERRFDEYPHQLSGGMRQRAMIAIALSCDPDLLFADEPTTALDVTVQAQVLDLLQVQRRERHMAMVLVTHDLGVVAGRADDVAVMYAGRVVEHTDVSSLFAEPKHPYTRALLRSIPRLDDAPGALPTAIEGRPPELVDRAPGCAFAPRCDVATDRCRVDDPALTELGVGHAVACHHPIETPVSIDVRPDPESPSLSGR
ncbi:MAG: dipeptide ABC transporter ATP-binding protein [Ilumatobacter fluminis]|uniref:dipeptide ABC transporter ATP-binding protein n=1 Tax=Ilumatobacter fluminis TaxID=467091 RepID=UPI0032EE1E0A